MIPVDIIITTVSVNVFGLSAIPSCSIDCSLYLSRMRMYINFDVALYGMHLHTITSVPAAYNRWCASFRANYGLTSHGFQATETSSQLASHFGTSSGDFACDDASFPDTNETSKP